jgi:hypothetical protein
MKLTPSHHEKKEEIETLLSQLKEERDLMKEQQANFEADREKYHNELCIIS